MMNKPTKRVKQTWFPAGTKLFLLARAVNSFHVGLENIR